MCVRGGGVRGGSRRRGICEDVRSVHGRRETSQTSISFLMICREMLASFPGLAFCHLQYKARGKQ